MSLTHTSEAKPDLSGNPEASVSETVPVSLENENRLSDVYQWQNENLGPLSSEKNGEKIVTVIKKVG